MMGIEEPWVDRDGACSFPDKWKSSPRRFPAPDQTAPEDRGVIEYRSFNTDRDTAIPDVERYLGQYTNPVFPTLVLKLEESVLRVGPKF